MNYKESKVYLEEISKYGSVLGLNNMKELLGRLGNPQDDLKFIHISGTNGKGSVLACISTVLSEAGYQVGRYISPTLFCYEERFQVNGKMISEEDLAGNLTIIADTIEQMLQENLTHPTVFEVETALCFLYFKEQGCDFVVLETGLGGAEDATNVIRTPIMEVITSISMDHADILGDTIAKIAVQKAGIIKPDTLVVTGVQDPEAMQVIEAACREKRAELRVAAYPGQGAEHASALTEGQRPEFELLETGCDLQRFSYRKWKNMEIHLGGLYQIENAAIALEAVDTLRETGVCISDYAVREGFRKAEWRGRFTVLGKEPTLLIDGAHNPKAAELLQKSLETYFPGRKCFFINGVFRDKEYEKMVDTMAPLAKEVVTIETAGNPRALPKERLKEVWEKKGVPVHCADSVGAATEEMLEKAAKEDVIVAFGSLSF